MKLIKRIKDGLKHKKSNIYAILVLGIAVGLVWFEKTTLTEACATLPVMFMFLMYKGKKQDEIN